MKKYLNTALSVTAAMAFSSFILPAAAGGHSAPGQCHTQGNQPAALMVRYIDWLLGDGPNGAHQLRFLPLPDGEQTGGSFTLADPGIVEGSTVVSLKPGESFMMPIVAWLGEVYADGSEDEPIPFSGMNLSEFTITIDGRTVAKKQSGAASPAYVPVTELIEPILYDEPTDYGSVGFVWVQGYVFTHRPLPPGRHVMRLHSTLHAVNYDYGVEYENTWVINVR